MEITTIYLNMLDVGGPSVQVREVCALSFGEITIATPKIQRKRK